MKGKCWAKEVYQDTEGRSFSGVDYSEGKDHSIHGGSAQESWGSGVQYSGEENQFSHKKCLTMMQAEKYNERNLNDEFETKEHEIQDCIEVGML